MNDETNLRDVRRDYQSLGMRRCDLDKDPVKQFNLWLQAAIDADAIDATAMVLATATCEGLPSARVVLLKHVSREGFCWYTDARSQKGQQIAENPHAALLFYWRDLNRQVRVVGKVEQLGTASADAYFYSRPEESRFSAASSQQTAVIDTRDSLEQRVTALHSAYPDGNVPRPDAWRGYRLIPQSFEFWQGKTNRLHDRIRYQQVDDIWLMERLSP